MSRVTDISVLKVSTIANLATSAKLNPYEPMVLVGADDITRITGTTKPAVRFAISNNDTVKTTGIVTGDIVQIPTVAEVEAVASSAIKRLIDPTTATGGTFTLATNTYNTFYLELTSNGAFATSVYSNMSVGQECTFFMLASGAERTFVIPTGTDHWKNATSVVIASGKTKEISLYKRSNSEYYWVVSEESGNV